VGCAKRNSNNSSTDDATARLLMSIWQQIGPASALCRSKKGFPNRAQCRQSINLNEMRFSTLIWLFVVISASPALCTVQFDIWNDLLRDHVSIGTLEGIQLHEVSVHLN